MDNVSKSTSLDFRYANPDDAADIVNLVNEAFSVDKGSTATAFRAWNRVSNSEVETCLGGGSPRKRWLVLETLPPEERMVAAALICTANESGKGSVDILAVDPSRQGMGLGTLLLRRAEGILLNFRSRYVIMRVPRWREDILHWAAKVGYVETGGGLWGELAGEIPQDLTKPARYVTLTRDLLRDPAVIHEFGAGSARFSVVPAATAHTSAMGTTERRTGDVSCEALQDTQTKQEGRVPGSYDNAELADFLAKALSGLTRTDIPDKDRREGEGASINDPQGLGVYNYEVPSNEGMSEMVPVVHTEMPVQDMKDSEDEKLGSPATTLGATSRNRVGTPDRADADVLHSNEAVLFDTIERVPKDGALGAMNNNEEISIESLLGSLMRALNTEQGRLDFKRLVESSSS